MSKNIKSKKIRRKVVCVFGKFDSKSDFVIEPVCHGELEKDEDSDGCKCEYCKDSFWIEGEVEDGK